MRGFEALGDDPVIPDIAVQDFYTVRQYTLAGGADGEYHLVGVTFPQEVVAGVNVASCVHSAKLGSHSDTVPDEYCTCGFYVYDSDKTWQSGPQFVRAVVRISGKTVVCEWGLRAAELEVVALSLEAQHSFDSRSSIKIAESLGESFPGVKIFKSDKELLTEYPLTRVDRSGAFIRRDPASRNDRKFSFETFALFAMLTLAAALLFPMVSDLGRMGLESLDPEPRKYLVIFACSLFTFLSAWHTASLRYSEVFDSLVGMLKGFSRVAVSALAMYSFTLVSLVYPREQVDYRQGVFRQVEEQVEEWHPPMSVPEAVSWIEELPDFIFAVASVVAFFNFLLVLILLFWVSLFSRIEKGNLGFVLPSLEDVGATQAIVRRAS